ncbi:unnamed protein product [Aphanomyces euteiches]|uniref:Amidase domain-containing protein n=1 Tax=Aphanomyces euteiches TaxID=100861 RepID=A0A6G0W4N1_9STRA|nr:hypothetical protein Ae201684_018679 [Aphanomyces euteiches]KAH9071807.1 hypothetical protein Ae201684P_020066 [Aphanomyces euteiches]KAH9144289.1 hypothetical protein AeRB84_011769 [Aphanomyces euteiches]
MEATHVSTASPVVMDLVPIQAPRLTGTALSLFAQFTRFPGLGKAVLKKIKKDNQFQHVRDFSATLNDIMPIYVPLRTPSIETTKEHTHLASTFSVQQLADSNVRSQQDENAFHRWTIQDFTRAYRAGTTTPLQVITAVLDAIEASNTRTPPLLAFVKVNRENALREAQASSDRYARGMTVDPLDGVPIGVKDELDVIGYTTSYGTNFLGGKVPSMLDAGPVARLRKAGAIIVGKTNMHEIGIGTFGINITTGTPRNPYNDQHMTGGSSSGSAAAVAAGLVPVAIGCDGGGSIRIPAGLCGIVGIKATYMRIPFHFQAGPSVAHVGPLAATVQDAALTYAIMSGGDPDLKQSLVQPPPFVLPPSKDLGKLRVGVFPAYVEGSDPKVVDAYQNTVEYLKELGAEIVEVAIPHLRAIHLAHSITILTEISQHLEEHPLHLFSPDTQIALALGKYTIESADFLAAQKVRAFAMRVTEEIFGQVDIFLTPTTATLAPRLEPDVFSAGLSELSLTTALMRFIILGNMVGIPGMSVPVAFDSTTKLPISVLLQANHWNEHKLIHVARLVESKAPSNEPSIFYSVLKSTDA